jgi:adenine-specific DNA-methyltransferase
MPAANYDDLSREDLVRLLGEQEQFSTGGLRLAYTGQTAPWQIVRKVRPRRQKIERKLCVGSEDHQAANLIIEGENLQAMVSLYKYRGQVDLILTDPPYNTGNDFRYNDRWDEDPHDPDLGKLVPADDGSRHSKWLRFMTPRVWMMKEMLKPDGVLAICIDHRELFRLGMLLDQVFGEENRLGIINWQKTTSKNDEKHLSTTTEYVLVYAKAHEHAKTALLERSAKTNSRFANPDNDLIGPWQWGDLTAREHRVATSYSIQSPFTGELHDPGGRHWANLKSQMKEWLELWGSHYVELRTDKKYPNALVLKGWSPANSKAANAKVIDAARKRAEAILAKGNWPILYWGQDGQGSPAKKHWLKAVKAGAVPTTFWIDSDQEPLELGSVAWAYQESGRSREGVEELNAIVGRGHDFETVKPLKLFRKLVQLWCPQNGLVFDPFAGSGTTAHAVLEANATTGGSRRFVLIEQGRLERGDPYARCLTAERVRRVIEGERADTGKDPARALGGGFRFTQLTNTVDAQAVLALEREEMLDLLLTSHWDQSERSAAHLRRLPAGSGTYLFAVSGRGEGFFLVWSGPGRPSVLDRAAFRAIAAEAKEANLKPTYHVYARICTYSGPNIEFYQIPNRILERLGFNEATQPFTKDGTEAAVGAMA